METGLKLGILKTGSPPAGLERFGEYPAMFERLLGEGTYDYVSYDVRAGELPAAPDACPAYVITGSASGVYDGNPWIVELIEFLRQARGRAALVGICFGHQVMAEAFGGKVVKAPGGWGVGAHTYDVRLAEPWLDGARTVTLPASHQDQVVKLPPSARVVAASAFTPFGMLAYPADRAMSLQLHPEFDPAYAAALVEGRRGKVLDEEQADHAISSLAAANDRAKAAGWIGNFLETTTA